MHTDRETGTQIERQAGRQTGRHDPPATRERQVLTTPPSFHARHLKPIRHIFCCKRVTKCLVWRRDAGDAVGGEAVFEAVAACIIPGWGSAREREREKEREREGGRQGEGWGWGQEVSECVRERHRHIEI